MKNALNFGVPIKLRNLTSEPVPAEKGGLFFNSDNSFNRYRICENNYWDNIISQTVFDSAIAELQAGIIAAPSKLEWQNSAKEIVSQATLDGLTPAVGDRYIVNDGANINKIAEYFESGWVYSTPGTDFGAGTFISVDDVSGGVYFWGWDTNQGTFEWTFKDWENPTWGDGLTLVPGDLGTPGALKVLAEDSTILVGASGIKVNVSDGLTEDTGLKVLAEDGTIVVGAFGVKVGTITDGNITDNTISGSKLVDNSVNGVKLVDNSVSYTKLNSDVWQYIQDSVVLYDGVTIGKNLSKELYVLDCAITTAKLADELDTATKAVKIKGSNGLFASKLKLFDTDYTKYVEEVYEHGITLTDNSTGAVSEFAFNTGSYHGEIIEYKMSMGSDYRVGTLYVAKDSVSDEFSESANLGVIWTAAEASGDVTVTYTTEDLAGDRTIHATIKKFIP